MRKQEKAVVEEESDVLDLLLETSFLQPTPMTFLFPEESLQIQGSSPATEFTESVVTIPSFEINNQSAAVNCVFNPKEENKDEEKAEKVTAAGIQKETKGTGRNTSRTNTLRSTSRVFIPWVDIDDIFLTGIVFDTYHRRHSLKPFDAEKDRARAASESVETIVWRHIHRRFEVARRRHEILTGEILASRTPGALQKRWKLKDKCKENKVDEFGCFLVPVPLSKTYEKIWDEDYNVNQIYTCAEVKFLSLLPTVQQQKRRRRSCNEQGRKSKRRFQTF